jgi:hypothetical protein
MLGCMRLRQLGNGQSVKFFAPEDVDRQIREGRTADDLLAGKPIGAVDVLRWVIIETCADLLHNVPHWLKQGVDYQSRRCSWDAFNLDGGKGEAADDIAKYWLQPEARALSDMYAPATPGTIHYTGPTHPNADMSRISKRCRELGLTVTSLRNSRLDEEQEREVDVEVECEMQVERPPNASPAAHSLHKDLLSLVSNGVVPGDSAAFIPVFDAIASLTQHPLETAWTRDLLATPDFLKTVIGNAFGGDTAQFARPVTWILSLPRENSDRLVLLSPFEANELLPQIRLRQTVHLHMYLPRVMQNCISFEDLRFYTIPPCPPSWVPPPPQLVAQLNIVAGQLYIRDFTAYTEVLDFLGLFSRSCTSPDETPAEIQGDGFVLGRFRRGRMRTLCPFKQSPVPFIKSIMDFRRKGMGYLPTHMGKVLNAAPLVEVHFA